MGLHTWSHLSTGAPKEGAAGKQSAPSPPQTTLVLSELRARTAEPTAHPATHARGSGDWAWKLLLLKTRLAQFRTKEELCDMQMNPVRRHTEQQEKAGD